MIDYNLSKIAQQEHERRVRSLVPVQDHDSLLNDDRKLSIYPILSGIAGSRQNPRALVSRVLAAVNNGLSSLNERTQSRHTAPAQISINDADCETVPC
jgi:hypothetical protein